jgi:hypothetical protein
MPLVCLSFATHSAVVHDRRLILLAYFAAMHKIRPLRQSELADSGKASMSGSLQ